MLTSFLNPETTPTHEPSPSQPFRLVSDFNLAGDQPTACAQLVKQLKEDTRNNVLMGVTGSGKTFTMAHVIERMQRPTLVLAPNKTLAAQTYEEMCAFFPNNAVNYFVSYYDYYQPEAYVPGKDLYIEKESSVNERIDRMRHAATKDLLERRDVIIVASVSCIYGIGDKETYGSMVIPLSKGQSCDQRELLRHLVTLQYRRNDHDLRRGTFRVRGDGIEIFPSHYEDKAWRLSLFDNHIESISEFDPLTGHVSAQLGFVRIYGNSHYVTPVPALSRAMKTIRHELRKQIKAFKKEERLIEAQRIEQRTIFDLEMLATIGFCNGIENYSRHLTGRSPGEPPPTLFEYLPSDALLIVDESHVAVPQLKGMYRGDFQRKSTLANYGFRLPSCVDNRPLKFEEWNDMRPQTIFVSATPGDWELQRTQGQFVEQVVRPTGLPDPVCDVRPVEGQVDDIIAECNEVVKQGNRVLITTLTKRQAEDLSDYLFEAKIKTRYMHSDIDTLERIDILRELRQGVFDVLVGINLLREGLDIPECALVAIFDADKSGFLRSETSLIQTMGRAARNINGRVILYADEETPAIKYALQESTRRRKKQLAYNKKYNITPQTIAKAIRQGLFEAQERDYLAVKHPTADKTQQQSKTPPQSRPQDMPRLIAKLEKEMKEAAANLEFEQAAALRDQIKDLQQRHLMPFKDA
ncbi:MAG: excinuclease ABC subunit UvrB [Alphaproteobacteria bacterium GM202ARS2]|nr:excinuclease ABC subunit UvrB [Alphaproteobacteria bacterium GM202ARS2]